MALLVLHGKLTSIYLFQHLAMVVSVAGLVALFGGVSLLRTVAAPVAFLLFAVPPPYWVITVLSWKFQQISSVLGVAMIELMVFRYIFRAISSTLAIISYRSPKRAAGCAICFRFSASG
ncbi:MAG: archaeosortase/exosortase family protein [Parvularculaceae bacterium]